MDNTNLSTSLIHPEYIMTPLENMNLQPSSVPGYLITVYLWIPLTLPPSFRVHYDGRERVFGLPGRGHSEGTSGPHHGLQRVRAPAVDLRRVLQTSPAPAVQHVPRPAFQGHPGDTLTPEV